MSGLLLTILLTVMGGAHNALAMEAFGNTYAPAPCNGMPGKTALIEARSGYLWGANEVCLRDGDNYNVPPMKTNVDLAGLIVGLQGEKFLLKDLAVRGQGWLNVPDQTSEDFFFNSSRRISDVNVRYIGVDLSLIYHFGIGGAPYSAGMVAGYRFNNFDQRSDGSVDGGSLSNDSAYLHVPYLGMYYADGQFVGTVVRLDILASPVVLARVDAKRDFLGTPMRIDGHSILGMWIECFFGWSIPLSDDALVGVFARYNFIELSGGATAVTGGASTRFSMDTRGHLLDSGISITYTF
ncbi:hypothetical protein ACFL2Q_17840 [Thermodesulfobacteriota bacterium]